MDLYKDCSNNGPWGQKWSRPGDHIFYKALYRENKKKSSSLKPQSLEPWYLLCNITQLTSSKYVQIMALGHKMGPIGGHMIRRGPSRENMKKASCLKPQGLEP